MIAPLTMSPLIGGSLGYGAYGLDWRSWQFFHIQSKEHVGGRVRFPLQSELVELILAAAILPL